ncbi:hypothetical protein Tco_0273498 [Tanacetum coccineum]
MWLVILTTCNLPSWLCMKERSFMLTLLIPGPKSPGKDIDVYLRPLIDDLKDLWAKPSVETIDACPTCNEDTPSTQDGDPPRKFDRDDIMAQLARLPTHMKGKHPMFGGVKIKRNVLVELNWTKQSIFYELEYWSFLTLKHNLDVMHIEKNVLESILNTLFINDKSKDTTKARQDLKRLGIRSGLWLSQNKNGKYTKPQAAYTFTSGDKKSLKSHDCHIMMQRLLPYELQQYLPANVAKPIIELCLFFKQICSQTLIEDDMLKAQSNVVDILCNLKLIYPPGFFDIMIHLVIHLPLEALKAKLEGSIVEGYVIEEALTFSSYYFQDVTTKFNRLNRNVDCPPPTCQFQVFISVCKSIGLWSIIRIDHQELKKMIWYVLHNSPEIDTYRVKFKSRDERHTTQNSGICSLGEDGEMYYGQLEKILEFSYMSFKTVLFQVKWFDTSNKGRVKHLVIRNNITQILVNVESFKNDQYILATQVKQCFYLEDIARRPLDWKVAKHANHKKFSNGGAIMVEDDPDIIHVDNSSDLALTTSLNDLEITALHIDGQSIDVDAPLDIIDVDEDDDIIDDEDVLPYDLADSDNEDLVNVDDDDDGMSDVARGHGDDGGGDDRPLPHQLAGGCQGSGKGTRKPNLGGRKAGRIHTRRETRNHELRKITDELGPQPIRFEWKDNGTIIPAERKAWVLEKIRDEQIRYWSDPKNMARCAQNAQNQAKSTVVCRQVSRTLAALRDRQMQSFATQEYPSLIQTFFDTHTVGDEEMLRLQGLGTYTDDQIMIRGGKQRRHILGVGRILVERGKDILDVPVPRCNHTSDVNKLKKSNMQLQKRIDMITKAMSSDDRYSQLFMQLQSQHESGSGAIEDDESGDNEDAEEDEEDADS